MIKLEKVTTDVQRGMIKNVIKKHHSYVPTADYPGRRIDWLIYDVIDEETWPFKRELLGMIGIGSCFYPPPKDILRYVGMSKDEYKNNFNQFANNWRFCFIKSVKNAGTQVLKQVRLQGPVDWKKKYGDELKYIITLVAGGNNGAVYKADNWKEIGKTAGLPKERKSISLKWDSQKKINERFVKPTGENKKLIFITRLK